MTVHMFRCFIGRGPMSVTDLETRIDDWVASNPEWTNDTVAHTLSERNAAMDGSGTTYHAVDVRFTENDTKSNLLQKFEDKLKSKVDWYRVGYHACTHRDGDGSSGGCNWDDKVDWTASGVTIPAGVPDFDVTA